jgi:hypothetical protein
MKLARVLLILMATAFIAFGVAYAAWPAAMVRDVGVRLTSTAARIDLAATYGGMQLGIGAFLYYCALRLQRVRTGLVATLAILAGLAGTRAIGMIATGEASATMWSLLAVEAIGVPLSITGLVSLNRAAQPTRS